MDNNDIRKYFFTAHQEKLEKNLRDLKTKELKSLDKQKKEEEKILSIHSELRKQEESEKKYSVQLFLDNIRTVHMDFQLTGIAWMVEMEMNGMGGILADEMGMGKTLQMLSLIANDTEETVSLVITPTIALEQWHKEIEKHFCENSVESYLLYKKNSEEIVKTGLKNKKKKTIIISSYGKIEAAYRLRNKGLSWLFEYKFHRIIVDEAHSIKDSKSSRSVALQILSNNTTHKWLMTGTPVQNRINDLYSLSKFLQLFPYAYYFCKKCDCKSIYWMDRIPKAFNNNVATPPSNYCTKCSHFSALHFSYFNRYITTPIKKYGNTILRDDILQNINDLTSKIILRRRKADVEEQLGIPTKRISVIPLQFTEDEKLFYESIFKATKEKIISKFGKLNENYVNIFALIQQMRMAVNHPTLITKKLFSVICGICGDEAVEPVASKCKHIFCKTEIIKYLEESTDCPICFLPMSIDLNSTYSIKKQFIIDPKRWHSSTKIEYICSQIYQLRKRNIKILIFSQFVNFLELLRWRLERGGFKTVKIYGNSSFEQRKKAIKNFNTDSQLGIFLISLKAGGLALNLTEASHVFICDLWWNPAVEDQAIDRIHRIGQHRPVTIEKVIIENSIESRILELQQKKKAMFSVLIDNDESAADRLTEDDLQFLFN